MTCSSDDRPRRSVAVIQQELADVERHLRDAPPHTAPDLRDHLEARLAALRRELDAARRPRRS